MCDDKRLSVSSSATLEAGLQYCRKQQRPDGSWEGLELLFLHGFVSVHILKSNLKQSIVKLNVLLVSGPGLCVSPTASGSAWRPSPVWVTSTRKGEIHRWGLVLMNIIKETITCVSLIFAAMML